MKDMITRTQAEIGIEAVGDFLHAEHGSYVQDGHADQNLTNELAPCGDLILDPNRNMKHDFVRLYRPDIDDSRSLDEIQAVMKGRIVLVFDPMLKTVCPATVSIDDRSKGSGVKVHTLLDTFNPNLGLTDDQKILLSAAGQSEAGSVGHCSSGVSGALEAEHFITIMNGAINPDVAQNWKNGVHINHEWRKKTSLMHNVSKESQGISITAGKQIKTMVISKHSQLSVLWHPSLEAEDGAESATEAGALKIVQGLAYISLNNAGRVDAVKELVEVNK